MEAPGAFYQLARQYTITLVVYIVLFAFCYWLLLRLRKSHVDYEEERDRSMLPLFICAACAAVLLASILLVPLNILASSPTISGTWLDSVALLGLWRTTLVATDWLFVALPFAWFYHEANGIAGRKGLLGRLWEATVNMALLAALAWTFFFVSRLLFNLQGVVEHSNAPLAFATALGCIIFLIVTPVGFSVVLRAGIRIAVPWQRSAQRAAQLSTLKLEARALQRKVDVARGRLAESGSTTSEAPQVGIGEPVMSPLQAGHHVTHLEERLKQVHQDMDTLRHQSHPLVANTFAMLVTLSSGLIVGYIMLRIVGSLIWLDDDCDDSDEGITGLLFRGMGASLTPLASLAVVVTEAGASVYLLVSSIVGLYSLHCFTQFVGPKMGDTTLQSIIVNAFVLLLLSSSFPFVARMLALQRFGVLAPPLEVATVSPWILLAYRVTFATLVAVRGILLLPSIKRHVFGVS